MEASIKHPLWADVRKNINSTLLIAWDECHKIYMALDQHEADWFKENYPKTFTGTADEMLATLHSWYISSCPLRLVSTVRHNATDPNSGYETMIAQFDERDPAMEAV